MDHTLFDQQDHTPGRFKIELSPFKSASALVAAIQAERGGQWTLAADRIGGRGEGEITVALHTATREIMTLWQDSRGGWWVEEQIKRGVWLPNDEYTLAIARHLPRKSADIQHVGAGNWTREEQDDMRHPTW